MMIWLIFIPAIASVVAVIKMASRTGGRRGEVDEVSEMEKGMKREVVEEEMRLRRGSGGVGVWRVE